MYVPVLTKGSPGDKIVTLMDTGTFNDLLTPIGQEAIGAAMTLDPVEPDFLRHFTALCRRFPREIARAALETAILRRRAASKFNLDPPAHELYFTRDALEQASAAEVSAYRARRYRRFDGVADVGCSVGGDTMALAKHAAVIGIDNDPLRLRMAAENACVAGVQHNTTFVQADATAPLPLCAGRNVALFFDPGRRANEKRAVSVNHYHPPLPVVHDWLPEFPDVGVKISPAVKLYELTEYEKQYGAELEFISLGGELKEAVLWFGSLRTIRGVSSDTPRRRATILPGPFTMTAPLGESAGDSNEPPRVTPPRAYLYEPDSAVLRARLVTTLATRLDLSQLDRDIAFLTGDDRVDTPYARSWPIEDWMPFNLKKLRALLRERRVGRITVKKRGSPIEPEHLIRDLRLDGDKEKMIVLTHHEGKPIVIVCPSPVCL